MKAHVMQDREQHRRQEMPSAEEQLEALWVFVASLPEGQVPPKARDMLTRIELIRRKYQKAAARVR